MDGKQAFPSIAPALGAVEVELGAQAAAIVGDWTHDGSSGEELGKVVGHVFAARGKLLRPALVLLSAGLTQPPGAGPGEARPAGDSSLVRLAAAVELLHCASLVHDDIIDGEPLRRGLPTASRSFGNHVAVLAGDLLYARCFALLTALEAPGWQTHREILALFSRTAQLMCLGEIREQQVLASGVPADFEEYQAIIRNKTAELMSACCRAGAVLGGAPGRLADALAAFGMSFGMAFQLLDDAADGDAPVRDGADLRQAAQEQLLRGRRLLSGLAAGPSRAELEAACDLVLAASQPGR